MAITVQRLLVYTCHTVSTSQYLHHNRIGSGLHHNPLVLVMSSYTGGPNTDRTDPILILEVFSKPCKAKRK